MDLKKFFLENVKETEYHYRFLELIKKVNCTYNIFLGYEESNDYKFEIYDVEEAIAKFRELCQPEINCYDREKECWFYLVTYYLYKLGYQIKEFPKVLARPPVEPNDFAYKEIRSRLIAQGEDDNGTVTYAARRKFVAELVFEQKNCHIDIDDWINQKFMEISNRQAPFTNMSKDEKLAEISNFIENTLKKNGKFVTPEYSTICFDYITNETVTKYRRQLHCFRHATEEAILERNSYSEVQKNFLIDYGLTIIKVIYSLTE